MKLISDESGKIKKLYEAIDPSTKEKSLYIEGIFAQAEKLNRNERVYPYAILKKAMDEYDSEYVKTSRALGELNHPESSVPNPKEACILIKSLKWDNNDVYGKAKVLTTPNGEIVKNLLKDGVQLGVSTRGIGSVHDDRNGNSVVEDDYEIKAIDVVVNPSGIDCWVNGILENVEYYYKKGILCEKEIEKSRNTLKNGDVRRIENDLNYFLKKATKNL